MARVRGLIWGDKTKAALERHMPLASGPEIKHRIRQLSMRMVPPGKGDLQTFGGGILNSGRLLAVAPDRRRMWLLDALVASGVNPVKIRGAIRTAPPITHLIALDIAIALLQDNGYEVIEDKALRI